MSCLTYRKLSLSHDCPPRAHPNHRYRSLEISRRLHQSRGPILMPLVLWGSRLRTLNYTRTALSRQRGRIPKHPPGQLVHFEGTPTDTLAQPRWSVPRVADQRGVPPLKLHPKSREALKVMRLNQMADVRMEPEDVSERLEELVSRFVLPHAAPASGLYDPISRRRCLPCVKVLSRRNIS